MFITLETGLEYVFQNPSTELALNVWFPNNRSWTKENLEPDTNGT